MVKLLLPTPWRHKRGKDTAQLILRLWQFANTMPRPIYPRRMNPDTYRRAPEPVWTLWRIEKFYCPYGDSKPGPTNPSPTLPLLLVLVRLYNFWLLVVYSDHSANGHHDNGTFVENDPSHEIWRKAFSASEGNSTYNLHGSWLEL